MSKSARWLPAAAVALCALALGLSMNVASALVPDDWSRDNALWIWIGVGVLGLPEPAPVGGEGQIVVGELPGAPPAPVARDAFERVAEAVAAGKVAAVTGSRGAGKTQVAAEYARRAAADGIELVAWVGADDRDDLLAGRTRGRRSPRSPPGLSTPRPRAPSSVGGRSQPR